MEDKPIKLLLIEDNPGDTRLIREILFEAANASVPIGRGAFELEYADHLSAGQERLAAGDIDVVLLDLSLPDSRGLDTFEKLYDQAPETPIVVLTGLNDEDLALKAVRRGAQDYLVKGLVDGNLLVSSVRYAIERKRAEEALRKAYDELKTRTRGLEQPQWGITERERAKEGGEEEKLVGKSEGLRQVWIQLSAVASTPLTVLILGETGTGKGLVARMLHELSTRREGPFIQVDCGAIPEALIESELFGHEKGAFTGATRRQLGKIERAEGGTLFLDEIGDLVLTSQTKLLRFLEQRTFDRVGGQETLSVDARVIAATNQDLQQMMSEGRFREDLYFRLQSFPISIPPLRKRREDVPLLASHFMTRMAGHLNKKVTHLTSDALATLEKYDWPGNVRELKHAVERAVIVCSGPAIRPQDIDLKSGQAGLRPARGHITPEEYEIQYIREVLEQTGWVIGGPRGAAAILGLPGSTLRYRMKKLGIRQD